MITQTTSVNFDEYQELFDKALQVLWSGNVMTPKVVTSADIDDYDADTHKTVEDLDFVLFTKDSNDNYIIVPLDTELSSIFNVENKYFVINSEYVDEIPTEISTLPEYFAHLGTIVDKVQNNETKLGQFLALPLDEPVFNIDADTRRIDIPKAFATNGVGVQGDHGAETLYFRINRFFDAIDLGNTNILIQYELPDETDSTLQFGTCPAVFKQLVSEPQEGDFVIFGWELENKITKNPGNVKFAIRFIKDGTDESTGKKIQTYSFSTLTTTIGINKALSLTDEQLTVDNTIVQNIINRIENSPNPDNTVKLQTPTFVLPSGAATVNLTLEEKDENGKFTGTYYGELVSQAYGKGGKIIYTWYKDNTPYSSVQKPEEFYEQLDTEYQSTATTANINYNLTYYQQNGSTYSIYPLKENEETFPSPETTPLYVKKCKQIVKHAGEYQVGAQARSLSSTSDEIRNEHKWTVPKPSALNLVSVTNTESVVMTSVQDQAGAYQATVGVTVSNNSEYQGYGVEWYRNYSSTNSSPLVGDDENKTPITGLTQTIKISTSGVTNASQLQALQGVYSIKVIGKKNNASTNAAIKEFIVTLPALKPIVKISELNTTDYLSAESDNLIKVDKGTQIKATDTYNGINYQIDQVTKNALTDKSEIKDIQSTSFEWYKINGFAELGLAEVATQAYNGNLTKDFLDKNNILYSNVSDKVKDGLLTVEAGYYVCIAENNYNSDKQVSSSPVIKVS